ncbi:unnamed protein product, partial [marine sediment metagenome]
MEAKIENKISLTIPGEPRAKQRPKWFKHGTYTPEKTVSYETYIKELFTIKYSEFMPKEEALTLHIWAGLLMPKSTSKKKLGMMKLGILEPAKKPDVDNILKTVMDALEKLAYKNDSQICHVVIDKDYSERPRL